MIITEEGHQSPFSWINHSFLTDICGPPWWFSGKESGCNADVGLIPELGRFLGEGNGNSTPVLLPGKSHGQGSLAGYNPWSHKQSDTT